MTAGRKVNIGRAVNYGVGQ